MAKIFFCKSGKQEEVEDGDSITQCCKNNGVSFSCKSGMCGTCLIEVVEGKENLNKMTENEKNILDEDSNERLACQVKALKGNISIK